MVSESKIPSLPFSNADGLRTTFEGDDELNREEVDWDTAEAAFDRDGAKANAGL